MHFCCLLAMKHEQRLFISDNYCVNTYSEVGGKDLWITLADE